MRSPRQAMHHQMRAERSARAATNVPVMGAIGECNVSSARLATAPVPVTVVWQALNTRRENEAEQGVLITHSVARKHTRKHT
jgi:hypothetical protein